MVLMLLLPFDEMDEFYTCGSDDFGSKGAINPLYYLSLALARSDVWLLLELEMFNGMQFLQALMNMGDCSNAVVVF